MFGKSVFFFKPFQICIPWYICMHCIIWLKVTVFQIVWFRKRPVAACARNYRNHLVLKCSCWWELLTVLFLLNALGHCIFQWRGPIAFLMQKKISLHAILVITTQIMTVQATIHSYMDLVNFCLGWKGHLINRKLQWKHLIYDTIICIPYY